MARADPPGGLTLAASGDVRPYAESPPAAPTPLTHSAPADPDSKETPMAVPKRKMSRSNTRSRRSQWKAQAPDLVPVRVNGQVQLVPRALVRAAHQGWVR